jgi:hypothetical protein
VADQEPSLTKSRNETKREMLWPILRPVRLLFVAQCNSLHEGEEHDLNATDAAWLGCEPPKDISQKIFKSLPMLYGFLARLRS